MGRFSPCDSMAVYRGLDIGTDKPSVQDRKRVKHHLLDVAEPGSTFSAGVFRSAALSMHGRPGPPGQGLRPVGGTGLYSEP